MGFLEFGGSLTLGGGLPDPVRLPGEEVIPGTVNLVLNPSLESAAVGTQGWTGADGVTIGTDTAFAFQGSASAACAFPAGNPLDTPQVLISTTSGLGWNDGVTILGSIYVLGSFEGLTLSLAATYTDATIETGPETEVDFSNPDAWTRPTCIIQPNPAKTLDSLLLIIERATGEAGGTVWLDAAQVERDAGWGVTNFATGQYGPPYHYWVGAEHLSPSVRDDIPADVTQIGFDGQAVISAQMFRGDASFNRIEDLSEHLIGASVTADRERTTAWTMTCRMTDAGYRKLRPWVDWLIPVLHVTDAQGVTRSGFLGHYVVLPSPATHFEHTGEVDIDCRSAEYLLDRQSFKGKLVVAAGAHMVNTAVWVLNSAGLGNSAVRPRIQITRPNIRAAKEYEFTPNDSKLTIVNELLEDAGQQSLWTSRSGILRSFRVGDRRYRELQPVRLWAANFDPGAPGRDAAAALIASRMPASTREVSGPVRVLPRLGNADNQIVVSSIDPRRPRVRAAVSIDDPSNPIGVSWTGRFRTKKFGRRMVPNNATALQMARAIAEDIGTRIDRIELSVLPDPFPPLLDTIVYLAIYRLDGVPAAVGRYRVLKAEYGFTPSNALMKLTLGFVHGVAELSGGVPIRIYDDRVQAFIDDLGEPIVLNIA